MLLTLCVVAMMNGLLVVTGQTVLSFTEVTPSADVLATTNVDLIGVRILFNHGVKPADASQKCVGKDNTFIATQTESRIEMYSVRKLLRNSESRNLQTASVNCARVCRGFAVGTCVRVYPSCTNHRELDIDEEDTFEIEDNTSNKIEEKTGERKICFVVLTC